MRLLCKFYLLFSVFAAVITACDTKKPTPANIPVTPRDTTITVANAFTLLKLDSQVLDSYLDSASVSDTANLLISNFYNSRNYQYAWFNEEGLTEHAVMLWNRYKDYQSYAVYAPSADSTFAREMDSWLTDSSINITPSRAQKAELKLTRLFFDYAFAKYIGHLDPADMQWHIPRRKINVSAVLDSLVRGNANSSFSWEPIQPQYALLRNALLDYSIIAENGGWRTLTSASEKIWKPGVKDSLIFHIKKRLSLTKQYPSDDTSMFFSQQLKDSIQVVQRTLGLKPNGMITPETIAGLNVPVEARMKQILVNMERLRWLPRRSDSIWILANIPSFQLQVLSGDSVLIKMGIVVGKAANRTVIFSDSLKYIVFSPYWNVPSSIVRNEILPAMKKNSNYLRKHRMEQTGTSNGLPVIRQLPGEDNALGKVKFIFPNRYNIYLHDTPAKSYFEETSRAFSHGCVRIGKPFELAQLLLQRDSVWTAKSIKKAMNSQTEKWVALSEPVPVFITYFTCWVDDDGRLQFRDDIYGHDERMISHLFTKQ